MKYFLCRYVCRACGSTPVSVLFTVLFAVTVNAQEVIQLDMEKSAKIAWDRARNVTIAQSQLEGVQGQSATATAFLNPQLNMSASYTRQDDIVDIYGLPNFTNVYGYRAQADIFLMGFGRRRFVIEGAQYRVLAAQSGVQSARNEAALLTRIAVLDIWLSRELIVINKRRIEQRRNEAQDTRLLEQAGKVSALDLRLADIAVARAHNELLEVETQLQLKHYRLHELLSPQLHDQKYILDGSLETLPQIAQLLHAAHEKVHVSSDLHELESLEKSTYAQRGLVRSERLPQFSGFMSYAGNGDEIDGIIHQWGVGVSMRWKIYDGGARSGTDSRYQASLHELSEQKYIVADVRSRFVKTASAQDEQLHKMREQQEIIVNLSEKNYQDTRVMYQAGSVTLTRLGESSLALDEARFTHARLHYQLHDLAIRLLHFIEREPTP